MPFMGGYSEFKPKYSYPTPPAIGKEFAWWDSFAREALNPTGGYTLYTAGNGTITLPDSTSSFLRMVSGATIGDEATVRTSGLKLKIAEQTDTNDLIGNLRSTVLSHYIVFASTNAVDSEIFVGILNSAAALTALPTTLQHVGLQLDRSASANFFFTEADGTTQTTTDTTIAADTAIYSLEIVWSASTGNTLRLRNDAGTILATRTTTRGIGTATPMETHFFVQTEGAAGKTLDIYEWGYRFT